MNMHIFMSAFGKRVYSSAFPSTRL